MIDWSIIERIFYAVGSSIALVSMIIKLKNYFKPPKIKIGPELFFDKKNKNKYEQDEILLEYNCDLLNTGRGLVGRLILETYFESFPQTHELGRIINLKKDIPRQIKGTETITPIGINIKEIKTPFKVKIFFQDMKGKKYALHEFTLGEGITGGTITKNSI